MDKIEIVIVTGMSGAGKTTAMAAFEIWLIVVLIIIQLLY